MDMLGGIDLGGGAPAAAPQAPQTPQFAVQPLVITTQELGSRWGTLPAERKVRLQTTMKNCEELMSRVKSGMNMHPVQIIGMEGLAAGQGPGAVPCFLHGKLQPPVLDVLIRSSNPALSGTIADQCQQILQ